MTDFRPAEPLFVSSGEGSSLLMNNLQIASHFDLEVARRIRLAEETLASIRVQYPSEGKVTDGGYLRGRFYFEG